MLTLILYFRHPRFVLFSFFFWCSAPPLTLNLTSWSRHGGFTRILSRTPTSTYRILSSRWAQEADYQILRGTLNGSSE